MSAAGKSYHSSESKGAATAAPHKACVVAWYMNRENEIFLLLGKESTYDTYDKLPEGPADEVEDKIRALLAPGEKFVIRQKRTAPFIKSFTRQSVAKIHTLYGFPKGAQKPEDRGLIMDAAIREFKEEIGYDLRRTNLKQLMNVDYRGAGIKPLIINNSVTFLYRVNDEEKRLIEERIETLERERKGELFDARFIRISELEKLYRENKLNSITRELASYFNYHRFNLPMLESIRPVAAASSRTLGRGGAKRRSRSKRRKSRINKNKTRDNK